MRDTHPSGLYTPYNHYSELVHQCKLYAVVRMENGDLFAVFNDNTGAECFAGPFRPEETRRAKEAGRRESIKAGLVACEQELGDDTFKPGGFSPVDWILDNIEPTEVTSRTHAASLAIYAGFTPYKKTAQGYMPIDVHLLTPDELTAVWRALSGYSEDCISGGEYEDERAELDRIFTKLQSLTTRA